MDGLRSASERLVGSSYAGDVMPLFSLSQSKVDELSSPTDVSALVSTVADIPFENTRLVHEIVVWIEACLRNPLGVESRTSVGDANALLSWIFKTLTPPELFQWKSAFDPDPQEEVPPNDVHRYQLVAVAGLRALSLLIRLFPKTAKKTALECFVAFATFTDNEDPWTRKESHEIAILTLNGEKLAADEHELVTQILQTVVRPNFSKQKQPAITSTGRKAINPDPIDVPFSSTPEAEEKPWKFRNPWVTTVFVWSVTCIEVAQMNNMWPHITPPTLAMIDDGAAAFKVKGCKALQSIISHADSGSLRRTGLGDVFEQALIPILALLPTLTEEKDSIWLLKHAYPRLFQLAQARFPNQSEAAQRLKSLDTIMRAGIIRGLSYAGEYPKIASLLVNEMANTVEHMGIDSVKHLKIIIPLLVDILCGPFVTASPTLISSTAQAIQMIIMICWPRISNYAGGILKGVAICWCRMEDDKSFDGVTDVKTALGNVLRLLKAALETDKAALQDIEKVLQSDDRLKELIAF